MESKESRARECLWEWVKMYIKNMRMVYLNKSTLNSMLDRGIFLTWPRIVWQHVSSQSEAMFLNVY